MAQREVADIISGRRVPNGINVRGLATLLQNKVSREVERNPRETIETRTLDARNAVVGAIHSREGFDWSKKAIRNHSAEMVGVVRMLAREYLETKNSQSARLQSIDALSHLNAREDDRRLNE